MGYFPDEITGNEDVLDSREVIRRLEHLERELEIAEDPDDPAPDYITEDERAELADLRALAADGAQNVDGWNDGTALVSIAHLATYIRSDPSDEYSGVDLNAWPFSCIDWDLAAQEKIDQLPELTYRGTPYVPY